MAGLLQVMLTVPFGKLRGYTTVLFVTYESATTKARWTDTVKTIYMKTTQNGFVITAESSDAGGAFRSLWMEKINHNPLKPYFIHKFLKEYKVFTIPDNGHAMKNSVATFEEFGPGRNRRLFVDMAKAGQPPNWR